MNETKTYITVSGIDLNGYAELSVLDATGGNVWSGDCVPVINGNAAFTRLELPCGNHRIVLQFESDPKSEFRSRGLLEIKPGDNRFAIADNFTEVKPTVISVVGIDELTADSAEITIWRGTEKLASGDAKIRGTMEKGKNTVVSLTDIASRFKFSGGGIFEVVLKLRYNGKTFDACHIPSESLNAETTNTVPFDRFTRISPFEMTLADIPGTYAGACARLALYFPGTDEEVATLVDCERLEIPKTTLTAWDVPAGAYDVVLGLDGDDGYAWFRFNSQSLPKKMDVAFCELAAMPTTTITVTGLECFNVLKIFMGVGDRRDDGHGRVWDGKVVFALNAAETGLPFIQSGLFPLTLSLGRFHENWKIERNITELRDNKFTFADFGGRPAIVPTVTGIDRMAHSARMRVFSGITEIASGDRNLMFGDNGLCTFILHGTDGEPFDIPGTYSLELIVLNNLNKIHDTYGLASKALSIDANFIPLADFTRDLLSITVDGIDIADARAASVEVFEDGKQVAYGKAKIKETKAVFSLTHHVTKADEYFIYYRDEDFNTPGTYRLELRFQINNAESRKFGLASKAMTAGTNIIPFADFKEVPYDDNR